VSKLKLHLDADTSIRSLQQALVDRGHNVTRTPCAWMTDDASDEEQLLGATAQGRCLFTFNIRDFTALAAVYARHGGIILAAQRRWTLSELIDALDRALATTEAEDLVGQVRWLNEWRTR
jgi:hypothetical protein